LRPTFLFKTEKAASYWAARWYVSQAIESSIVSANARLGKVAIFGLPRSGHSLQAPVGRENSLAGLVPAATALSGQKAEILRTEVPARKQALRRRALKLSAPHVDAMAKIFIGYACAPTGC
jgi:hypothetical protein